MSKWRDRAIRLFPEYRRGSHAFQRSDLTIYQIFFELLVDLDKKIEVDDRSWLLKVLEYVEWCHHQKKRAPDVWNAAATAFLEHLADEDRRAALIPEFVSPTLFVDMWPEFRRRRERKGSGKARELLDAYNVRNGSHFPM